VRPLFPMPEQIKSPQEVVKSAIKIEELSFFQGISKEATSEFKGGETEALKRLNYYLWESQKILTYKETRNGLLGFDYSSKFSPWLANGSLSPRKIYWEIKKFEQEVKSNQSTYWLVFELIWRDFFKFYALKFGNKMFHLSGTKDTEPKLSQDRETFDKWANGETGIPFIDANMSELNQTGFMSNRGRQNVASFLVKDLKIDWRMGAEYFESLLLDYDVPSNWGNWNYVSGVGSDPREGRYFNVLLQASRYDAKAKYVKHWISTFENFDSQEVFLWSKGHYNPKIDYHKPVVIPEAFAKV